jgi:hypothetical protein
MFKLKIIFLVCTLVSAALTVVAAYRFFTILLIPPDDVMPELQNALIWGVIQKAHLDIHLIAGIVMTLLFGVLFLVIRNQLMKDPQGDTMSSLSEPL